MSKSKMELRWGNFSCLRVQVFPLSSCFLFLFVLVLPSSLIVLSFVPLALLHQNVFLCFVYIQPSLICSVWLLPYQAVRWNHWHIMLFVEILTDGVISHFELVKDVFQPRGFFILYELTLWDCWYSCFLSFFAAFTTWPSVALMRLSLHAFLPVERASQYAWGSCRHRAGPT